MRQHDLYLKTRVCVFSCDGALMDLNSPHRDRQPKPDATAVGISRFFRAEERLEYLEEEFFGNTGPMIANFDDRGIGSFRQPNFYC